MPRQNGQAKEVKPRGCCKGRRRNYNVRSDRNCTKCETGEDNVEENVEDAEEDVEKVSGIGSWDRRGEVR